VPRRLSLAATLALVLCTLLAAPAHAEFIDTLNGHNAEFFTKGQSTPTRADDNGNCFVDVAADLHRRHTAASDDFANAVRGVGRIERGDCALRVQVDLVRVGSIGGTQVVDDCRLNTDGLTPCLPAISGTRFRAYGEGDWITEGTPGGGTESLRCAYAVRVNVSVRWVGNALERFTLRSFYTPSDVFHCVDR
jgi:hypothetical protein